MKQKFLIDKVTPRKFMKPGSQPMEIVTLKPAPNPPCKKCNKNPRRQSSAYCGECSIKFHSGL